MTINTRRNDIIFAVAITVVIVLCWLSTSYALESFGGRHFPSVNGVANSFSGLNPFWVFFSMPFGGLFAFITFQIFGDCELPLFALRISSPVGLALFAGKISLERFFVSVCLLVFFRIESAARLAIVAISALSVFVLVKISKGLGLFASGTSSSLNHFGLQSIIMLNCDGSLMRI